MGINNYTYVKDEGGNSKFKPGDYRCMVTSAEKTTSKSSGKPMIVVKVRISGTKIEPKVYIVENDNFDRNISRFFDAFPEIKEGNFDLPTWVGAVGAAKFDYDENGYAKQKWWIPYNRQADLPPYEGDRIEMQEVTNFEELNSEDELPF